MLHIPAIRQGNSYKSLEKSTLVHHATGDPLAEVSQITGSMVVRDLAKLENARRELHAIPMSDLIERVKLAGKLFGSAELPVGDTSQSFEEYLQQFPGNTFLAKK